MIGTLAAAVRLLSAQRTRPAEAAPDRVLDDQPTTRDRMPRRGAASLRARPPAPLLELRRPVLAVLVKRFPRLSETFVLNEVLELRRQGLPVKVFAILDPRERHTQGDARLLREEVVYLRPAGRLPWFLGVARSGVSAAVRHPLGLVKAVWFCVAHGSTQTWKHLFDALQLVRALRSQGVGHLHAHFAHNPASIACLAHTINRIPFSFTAHAKDLFTSDPAHVTRRAKAAEFVVTCTAANRVYLRQLLGPSSDKVVVCPHGVDRTTFGAVTRVPVPGRILSIGRLVPKKGFDVLLEALAILETRGVPFECHIFGGGPLRGELERLTGDLGIAPRVLFGGARPQVDLMTEYGQASVFALAPVVMPDGDRDGVPNVLTEAMAVGIPVVATSISGIPELVDHGRTGVLVPPGDPLAFADALESVLADATLRGCLGLRARREVLARRELSACVRPLAEMFRQQLAVRR